MIHAHCWMNCTRKKPELQEENRRKIFRSHSGIIRYEFPEAPNSADEKARQAESGAVPPLRRLGRCSPFQGGDAAGVNGLSRPAKHGHGDSSQKRTEKVAAV